MSRAVSGICAFALLLSSSATCFADMQYTEQSKMTGGAAMGAMKFAGVFSKDARQTTSGTTSTISIKGNRMRRESSTGQAEIYDLDGRRVINIDLKHKTYSVVTFDEMRAQMEEAKKKAAAEQAKKNGGDTTQVQIKPKVSIEPGGGSKEILNYNAKEMKTRLDMEMKAQDNKGQNDSGNMWVNSDAYVAPVKGYDELKKFYMKMAKELDWIPGTMFGGNAQMSQPMVEYRKSAATMNGMPLLSYVSVGMGPNPGTTGQAAAAANPSPEKKESTMGKVGGMFGGFGKKSKNDPPPDAASGQPSGSLMDMTTEVTSISTDSLAASLFEVPSDFKQVDAKKGQVQ